MEKSVELHGLLADKCQMIITLWLAWNYILIKQLGNDEHSSLWLCFIQEFSNIFPKINWNCPIQSHQLFVGSTGPTMLSQAWNRPLEWIDSCLLIHQGALKSHPCHDNHKWRQPIHINDTSNGNICIRFELWSQTSWVLLTAMFYCSISGVVKSAASPVDLFRVLHQHNVYWHLWLISLKSLSLFHKVVKFLCRIKYCAKL